MGGNKMFKKAIRVAMCVVGILSLACVAAAGDLMQWNPRTPAGGGSPGFIGSYLSQAAAVEYGPAAVVNRDMSGKSIQESILKSNGFSTTRVLFLDKDGKITSIQESASEELGEQTQENIIYRTP
jgi:hypothetical protein